mmetsp:Transcript_32450/g.85183  ORF Transcript_32450/g.85183 Transcript_32450/m.85183 type:complete len:695 (+) Transcript_32450:3-2087(+)
MTVFWEAATGTAHRARSWTAWASCSARMSLDEDSISISMTPQSSERAASPAPNDRRLVRAHTKSESFGELLVDKQRRNFGSEVEEMRAHIRRHHKLIFHPARHKWLTYFDNFVGGCVLFVSMVSPVDITMSTGDEIELSTVYLIGLFCNFVFALDCFIKLNRAYRDKTTSGARWIKDRRMIFLHYLRTWLVIDVLSSIPFDLPFALGMADAGNFTKTLRMANLVRLLRVVKLISTLPLMLTFMRSRLNWSNAATEILKFGILLLLMIHYLACLWAYTGLNWEATEGVTSDGEQSWITANNMQGYAMHRLYAVSIYVAMVSMFGGVSSIAPQNFAEYVILTAMIFTGGMAWAYVLSMLCSIFSMLNPGETAHKNLMDELTSFMNARGFDREHRQRLTDFFNYTKDYSRELGYSQLFERMSTRLRADTALKIGEGDLKSVWYLNRSFCETSYLCDVALNLKPSVHEIHENLPLDRLTLISRGLVAQNVKLMSAGTAMNIDCIIPDRHLRLRSQDPIVCLSFVHVHTIKPDTLFELAENYPKAHKSLGVASRHLTVRAALLMYYRCFVKKNRQQPEGGIETAVGAAIQGRRQKSHHTRDGADSYTRPAGTDATDERLDELTRLVKSLAIKMNERERSRTPLPQRQKSRSPKGKHTSLSGPRLVSSVRSHRNHTDATKSSGGRTFSRGRLPRREHLEA